MSALSVHALPPTSTSTSTSPVAPATLKPNCESLRVAAKQELDKELNDIAVTRVTNRIFTALQGAYEGVLAPPKCAVVGVVATIAHGVDGLASGALAVKSAVACDIPLTAHYVKNSVVRQLAAAVWFGAAGASLLTWIPGAVVWGVYCARAAHQRHEAERQALGVASLAELEAVARRRYEVAVAECTKT